MSNIAIISGSHRPAGNSGRIAKHIEAELQKRGHTTSVIDLAHSDLPFWDEGTWGAEGLKDKWAKLWNPVADQFTKAEGIVLISPEYAGNIPSRLTNLLLLLGNGPLVAHKPALLVGVTSTMGGGTYPVAQLRANGSKNNRMVFLPEHLIVRDANDMFTPSPKPEKAGAAAYIEERLQWNLTQLEDYIPAFNQIRKAGHTQNEKFPNGM